MLEHLGIRWGYVFLRGAVYLSEEEMRELMNAAVEMYLQDEDERKIVRSEYEGKLSTERRYELLGSFGGQRFNVELETVYGRDSASFLVNEQTRSLGPAFSLN
jgi:hypothetical protein